MARPSEIETKTVSVRLPMTSYIRILQEAIARNLSLSEYLMLKIMTGDAPAPPEVAPMPGVGSESTRPAEKAPEAALNDLPEERLDMTPTKRPRAAGKKRKPAAKPSKPAPLQPVESKDRARKLAEAKQFAAAQRERIAALDFDKVPAPIPTAPVPSITERRATLKKQMAKLGRRLAGYNSNGNVEKANEMLAERAGIQKQLDAIKGKRK